MSAPAQDTPLALGEDEGKKKKGVSKYLSRMKTVLRRNDGSKRLSFSAKSPAAVPSTAGPSTTTTPQPAVAPEQPTPEPVEVEAVKGPEVKRVMRSEIQAERARKLGERFAVTIEPFDFKEDMAAIRIEKPIRMRIHRSCHRCSTTFGGNKICAQCQHTRCKTCPRYPPKQDKGKARESTRPADWIEPENYWNMKDDVVLTLPSRKVGGQPLVRKKPKQRIRRNCHECRTMFAHGTKVCTGCGHTRCTDCPRDPAKKKKYPDGYPGDAFSTNTSRPVKYSCSKCRKVFPAVPHPDSQEGKDLAEAGADAQKCERCGHERCPDCPRAPPQRVEPTVDPEVLKSLQAKLEALNVSFQK